MALTWETPTAIETPDDIAWLRETHCPDMPANIRFATLYGNEDSPALVEGWHHKVPHYLAQPDYTWEPLPDITMD